MKVNITVNDELLKKIDMYADQNFMSRSGLISLAASQYLNGLEISSALKDLAISMRKIADTNELDDETMQKLDDFRTLVKFLPVTM